MDTELKQAMAEVGADAAYHWRQITGIVEELQSLSKELNERIADFKKNPLFPHGV